MYEIGIDTGGTFTDVVCRSNEGSTRICKLPSTRANPGLAILSALEHARSHWGVDPADIILFAHGTTVATNAVLERRGARIGLIMSEGFRDVLEIGRQSRRDMYDLALTAQSPMFLAPRRLRKEVPERMDAAGRVAVPLDEAATRQVIRELRDEGVQAIAVCLLFSFLNPAHESRIAELISEEAPGTAISLSSQVDPAFREYERTCVTAFDSYVKPVIAHYLADVEDRLRQAGLRAPLQVMQSRGGLASATLARERPVRLFLSGPAAGVLGGLDVGLAAGFPNLITVDIGGTSCDIALISDGQPMIRAEGLIDGFTVRVPMVDVTAVGSGGGSLAWLDGAGSLRVGPASAGSEPGPACYGRGGKHPTVTDASLVLGYLDPANFAGGSITLQTDAAWQAVKDHVAGPLGLSEEDAALGIHRVVNAQMAEAIRLVSIGRGIDPRDFVLLPLGGGGTMHATALAEELGTSTVLVPPNPGVLAAAGLLGAPVEHELSAAFPRALDGLALPELLAALDSLQARCGILMQSEGIAEDTVRTRHFLDICYAGQSHALQVAFDRNVADPLQAAYRDFLAVHQRIYSHAIEHPARLLNIRVVQQAGGRQVARDIVSAPHEGAGPGKRAVRVRHHPDRVPAFIWQRAAMTLETRVLGPAIIEQEDTTTLVEPGWTARLAQGGAMLLERSAVS